MEKTTDTSRTYTPSDDDVVRIDPQEKAQWALRDIDDAVCLLRAISAYHAVRGSHSAPEMLDNREMLNLLKQLDSHLCSADVHIQALIIHLDEMTHLRPKRDH